MTKIAKITDETHEDLQAIQTFIIEYGTKSFPPEFISILESLKDKPSTYKTIIGIAVKFLRTIIEQIEEQRQKKNET